MTDATFEKIVLMLVATPGMMAPADTATKPAINAYSMRSWPFWSFQIFNFRIMFFILFYSLSDVAVRLPCRQFQIIIRSTFKESAGVPKKSPIYPQGES